MHVFRLMAMPDKIIAIEGLPERMVEGIEMCRADSFPRHWKEWLGKRDKIVRIPPDRDQLTGQVRKYEPIVESDHYFYLIDWNLNPVVDKWKEICAYVRQNVVKDFPLRDKIDDMAKPLADNKTDGVSLEPEDVVIIPLVVSEVESLILPQKQDVPRETFEFKCKEPGCTKEFDKKQALRMHTMKRHRKEAVTA